MFIEQHLITFVNYIDVKSRLQVDMSLCLAILGFSFAA